MSSSSRNPSRRVMRDCDRAPDRYWASFISLSVIAHLAVVPAFYFAAVAMGGQPQARQAGAVFVERLIVPPPVQPPPRTLKTATRAAARADRGPVKNIAPLQDAFRSGAPLKRGAGAALPLGGPGRTSPGRAGGAHIPEPPPEKAGINQKRAAVQPAREKADPAAGPGIPSPRALPEPGLEVPVAPAHENALPDARGDIAIAALPAGDAALSGAGPTHATDEVTISGPDREGPAAPFKGPEKIQVTPGAETSAPGQRARADGMAAPEDSPREEAPPDFAARYKDIALGLVLRGAPPAEHQALLEKTPLTVPAEPAPAPPEISFETPRPGGIIDASEDSRVQAAGLVTGAGIKKVVLYLNGAPHDAHVKDGRFTASLPVDRQENSLYAEVRDILGRSVRSPVIGFRAVLPRRDIVVRFARPAAGSMKIRTKWAAHPLADAKEPEQEPHFKVVEGEKGGMAYVGAAAPGIYTFGLDYDLPQDGLEVASETELFANDGARKRVRKGIPVRLAGRGHYPAVRVLMPEGVFWEDDSWFTGSVDDGKSIIKFRRPEGILWKEAQ